MNETTRIRLRITGRVQGVGFRRFVREAARRLGLAGQVRNEPYGAVEVEAEGPADLMESFRMAVERGPDAAQVATVESLPTGAGKLPHPFALVR